MRKRVKISFIIMLVIITGSVGMNYVLAEDLTGEEIMNRVEDNHFIASALIESELIVMAQGREIVREMITFVESDGEVTNALVEFINPGDRGTKYLMKDDELWMSFPDAEDLIRISGHMLEEGMMGSDFSFQDVLESERVTELYEFEKEDKELLDDRQVYVIYAVAKEDKDVAYYSRRSWVDADRFVILKEEMYDREGHLMKVMTAEKIEEIEDDRWMPTKMVMEDKLLEDSRTIYHINEINMHYDIPEDKISLDEIN